MNLKDMMRYSQPVMAAVFEFRFGEDTLYIDEETTLDMVEEMPAPVQVLTLPAGCVPFAVELVVEGVNVPGMILETADNHGNILHRATLNNTWIHQYGNARWHAAAPRGITVKLIGSGKLTTGKMTIRVVYTVEGRATEVH